MSNAKPIAPGAAKAGSAHSADGTDGAGRAAQAKSNAGKTSAKSNAKGSANAEAKKATARQAEVATAAPKPAAARAGKMPSATTPVHKVRRPRAPADLAAQYGERTKTRQEPAPEEARKTRRNMAQRAKRRAVMTPSEELLQRLDRAGTLATEAVFIETGDDATGGAEGSATPQRRSRKWVNQCGKCGTSNTFSSAAGLCPRCGAIAVRE